MSNVTIQTFNKQYFCDLSVDTVLFILSSATLNAVTKNNKGGFHVNMKSKDYVEYFALGLTYYFIPYDWKFNNYKLSKDLEINNTLMRSIYIYVLKSIVDMGLFEQKMWIQNLLSIGVSDALAVAVKKIRSDYIKDNIIIKK
jgi:hypothetical protein